jgi:ABC-2 type transport system ATP-binding protein
LDFRRTVPALRYSRRRFESSGIEQQPTILRTNMRNNIVALFEDVTKVFSAGVFNRRSVRALDQISFSISAGEVFGLIGPNRAGKTTLVKILLTICRPTSGRIWRLGRDGFDRSTLTQVGYVHESQSFPPYLTARSLLNYYGALSRQPSALVRRRGNELLEQFGLADRSREPIGRFSKGMLQRLAMAQALINDPELLVLDEPSEGMDVAARRLLHDVIRQRRLQGHTVILVSHLLSDIERLCDRVAILRGGCLGFLGRVTDLSGTLADHMSIETTPSCLEELSTLDYAATQ